MFTYTLVILGIGVAHTSYATSNSSTLATVNGKAITQSHFDQYIKQRDSRGTQDSLPQQMVLEELINRELITQNAAKQGLDKETEFTETLEGIRVNLLAAYAMQKMVKTQGEPTEEEIKKEYQVIILSLSNKEYNARHILLEKEAEAKDVIAMLDKGSDFNKLADEKSIDPTGTDGGSLGWFLPENMTQAFADAVRTLKKDSYTKTPVETEYGWHVILLEDSRDVAPPPFEALKDQIANSMMGKNIRNYIKSLRDQAKIEIE
jgi:peptidyl-prolyl cis-trans isomerase C